MGKEDISEGRARVRGWDGRKGVGVSRGVMRGQEWKSVEGVGGKSPVAGNGSLEGVQ